MSSLVGKTILVASLLAAGCSVPGSDQIAQPVTHSNAIAYPRFNQVLLKATHNAYWLNNAPGGDPDASGVQERLIDQLLHERVRSVELDLHYEGGHAGEFTVYHTDSATRDSQCHYLADCLAVLQRLDYLEPAHEPIVIILEFKETVAAGRLFGSNGVIGLAKQDHHPQDLDRLLWERLGSRLFTPRELMSRCPGASTLRECVKRPDAWPTTDQLRGRYIVNVIGNWVDNYWDWIEYANDEGGMMARAAFPLRSMMNPSPDFMQCGTTSKYPYPRAGDLKGYSWHPEIELNSSSLCANADHPYIFSKLHDAGFIQRLQTARDASIFWQTEDGRFARLLDPATPEALEDFLAAGGVSRTSDASNLSQQQWDLQNLHEQLYMTDYPWSFMGDGQPPDATHPGRLPTRANRPFFEAADMDPSQPRKFSVEALTEPGNRIYLSFGGEASVTLGADGDDVWETQPSSTTVTHTDDNHNDDLHPPPQSLAVTGGEGCLFARAPSGDELRVCRRAQTDSARTVTVDGYALSSGKRRDFSFNTPLQHFVPGDTGDLLSMRVHRQNGSTTITLLTATVFQPDGSPLWVPLPGGSYSFASNLSTQGLFATTDELFVGTRHNGAPVTKRDFTRFPTRDTDGYAWDLSWCLDGSCRGPSLPGHEDSFTGFDGGAYVGVHEAAGHVFGQDRHLYTTDRYEAQTSGLIDSVKLDEFVLRRGPAVGFAPLYRCLDWRRDDHTFWLSRDAACTNDKGQNGINGGVIGYLSPNRLDLNQAPLQHYRRGTQNDGSDNTHDHEYQLGYPIVPSGYEWVETVGWVYLPSTVSTPPCKPRTTCGPASACGTEDDGCGTGEISCGMCTGSAYCDQNKCIVPGTNCQADCRHQHDCGDTSDPVFLKNCLVALHQCLAACDCKPQTCASLGLACGAASDGCGHTLACGGCASGSVCSSGQCVCVPLTDCNGQCGNLPDGCGGVLHCGSCSCTPKCAGKRCGAGDGCGHTCFGSCAKVGYVCTDDGNGGAYCARGD